MKRERTRRALTVETQEQLASAEAISLKQAMDEFLVAKAAERAAPRTLYDYRRHFRYLLRWFELKHPELGLTQITSQVLREYVLWMSDEKERYDDHPKRQRKSIVGLSPMTVNVRIRTMKAFFNWCQREDYIPKSPARDIKLQKVDNDNVSGFTEHR